MCGGGGRGAGVFVPYHVHAPTTGPTTGTNDQRKVEHFKSSADTGARALVDARNEIDDLKRRIKTEKVRSPVCVVRPMMG